MSKLLNMAFQRSWVKVTCRPPALKQLEGIPQTQEGLKTMA